MKKVVICILFVLIFSWLVLVVINANSSPVGELGLHDGKLASCPDSPNCVSSFSTDEIHAIEPIAFEGTVEEAMTRIESALQSMSGVSIVASEENYIRATATTMLMRYIDDIEFTFDEQDGKIHFRSASRIGYSDLGANRKRMESFRKLFTSENP